MPRLWAPSVFFLLLFLPLLWISRYAYPSGDDFQIAFLANKFGPAGATKWWYFNGCGRYSYIFLQSLISGSSHWLLLYRILPFALLLAGFASLFYFVRAMFGMALSIRASLLLSASLYTLLIDLTPDIATAFYWLTTSIQYAGAFFGSLLLCGLLINFARSTNPAGRLWQATGIVLLIVFVAGTNEASALLLCAVLLSINLVYVVTYKKPSMPALMFAAISIAAALFSFLSPGTGVRLSQVPRSFGLLKLVAGAIGLTSYLLVDFLLAKPILPATLLYFLFLSATRERLEQARRLFGYVRWYWIAIAIFVGLTGVNLVIFAAVGPNSLIDRLKNVYVYNLFIGWFVLMTAVFFQFVEHKREFRLPNWMVWLISIFLVGFLLFGSKFEIAGGNATPDTGRLQRLASSIHTGSVYTNAYLDIVSGRADRFAEQNRGREAELKNATGDTIEFSLYSYAPETIFIQDVNHPFGEQEWLTLYSCGAVKRLNYRQTGPPMPPKRKF